MTNHTQELCERLRLAEEDALDCGLETDDSKLLHQARTRIAALEAKCALLAASLAQAEREKNEAEKHAAEVSGANLELQAQITSANDAWMELYGALTKRYEELEAQLAEAKQGEPFGWMTDKRAFTKSRQIADQWRKSGYEITELFDHPPAAAARAEDDLREQVEDLRNAVRYWSDIAKAKHSYMPAAAASEDKRDAERWRYVKNHYLVLIEGDDADAFIDAAIASEKERQK
jgi:BMFP domain-containing protein YqiC